MGCARRGEIIVLLFLLGAISRPFQGLEFVWLLLDSCFVGSCGYFFSSGSSVHTFVQREGEIISSWAESCACQLPGNSRWGDSGLCWESWARQLVPVSVWGIDPVILALRTWCDDGVSPDATACRCIPEKLLGVDVDSFIPPTRVAALSH